MLLHDAMLKQIFCRGCGADQLQVRRYMQTAVKERSKASPDLIVACDVAAVPYADAYAALVQTLVDNCSNHSTVVLLGYQVKTYCCNPPVRLSDSRYPFLYL